MAHKGQPARLGPGAAVSRLEANRRAIRFVSVVVLGAPGLDLLWRASAGLSAALRSDSAHTKEALVYEAEMWGFGAAVFSSLAVVTGVVLGRIRFCPQPRGHCAGCGYNLTGNVSGICPECGTPIPQQPAGSADTARTEGPRFDQKVTDDDASG